MKGVVSSVDQVKVVKEGTGQRGPWKLWASKIHFSDNTVLDVSAFNKEEIDNYLGKVSLRDEIEAEAKTEGKYTKADLAVPIKILKQGVSAADAPAPVQGVPPEVWERKDRRITRLACINASIEYHKLLTDCKEGFGGIQDVLKIAGELEVWVYRGFEEVKP